MTDPPAEPAEPRRDAIRLLGLTEPPELEEALSLPVERGHHLAIVAAEGSGKELLYATAARHRCDPDAPDLQALLLVPTREGALRAAAVAHALGAPDGLACLAWPPVGAAAPGAGEAPFAHLLAGRPEALLAEVRAGRLGVGALRLLVVDGVRALEETGSWASVEALLDTLDPDAQRIACAEAPGGRLEELLVHRLPRARRWPPELFAEPGGAEAAPAPSATDAPPLLHAAAAGELARLERLAEGLQRLAEQAEAERAFVHCPDEATARRTAAYLTVSGFRLADEEDGPGLVVAWGEDEAPAGAVAALFGLPAGLPRLRRVLEPAPHRLAVVESGHLPQLRILARRAGWPVRALPDRPPRAAEEAVTAFRERVRARAREGDPAVDLLLLEPLLEELGSAEVSAALASLLRERPPAAPAAGEGGAPSAPGARPSAPGREREAPPRRAPREAGRAERAVRPAWTRIWISVGKRDGAGPGDIVGAITGETSAVGGQIGKIEIRSSYSLVDLDSQVADDVVRRLEGARIKGSEVHARLAREG